MFKRAYVEITNICNLNCSFCIGTKRSKKFMSADEFKTVASKIRPFTEYIYLHVLGEPLLHPELEKILKIAEDYNFKVNITTNGLLIDKCRDVLLNCKSIRKISFSLHSFDGNNSSLMLKDYLNPIFDFSVKTDAIVELRLWNNGGADINNKAIIDFFLGKFDINISDFKNNTNMKLKNNIYFGFADKFFWPSLSANIQNTTYCYGLKTQFAVLCDGSVVPCCLDSEGSMVLGNIFESELQSILSSDRAKNIVNGFNNRKPTEELCKRCQYASRF